MSLLNAYLRQVRESLAWLLSDDFLFRIYQGKVKQIVGSTLRDSNEEGSGLVTNLNPICQQHNLQTCIKGII